MILKKKTFMRRCKKETHKIPLIRSFSDTPLMREIHEKNSVFYQDPNHTSEVICLLQQNRDDDNNLSAMGCKVNMNKLKVFSWNFVDL